MIEETNDELLVIADRPEEMVEAQTAMVSRVGEKLQSAEAELADVRATLEALVAAGMQTTAADRLHKRASARIDFLQKTRAALEAGYLIVPEMPCDIVAIRVKRKPRWQGSTNPHGYMPSISEESAPGLPEGVGNYVDPLPRSTTRIEEADGKRIAHRTTDGDWDNEIVLPVEFLRANVVQRTGKVMMRKLFDEIAVVGADSAYSAARSKKIDPMVIGSIIDRARKRKLWFLVAWFVDTTTI